jgi:hypothetical protein
MTFQESNPASIVSAAVRAPGWLPPSVAYEPSAPIVEIGLADFVDATVAAFRYHPHVNNVMTHICGGKWERVGQVLRVIVDARTTPKDLSPLARNIVELICAERGVTGRILKPYFRDFLARVLPAAVCEAVWDHLLQLSAEMKRVEPRPDGDA